MLLPFYVRNPERKSRRFRAIRPIARFSRFPMTTGGSGRAVRLSFTGHHHGFRTSSILPLPLPGTKSLNRRVAKSATTGAVR